MSAPENKREFIGPHILVSTKFDEHKIYQTIEYNQGDYEISDRINNLRGEIIEHVMDTRDKAIEEALIRMGWTPPPKDKH